MVGETEQKELVKAKAKRDYRKYGITSSQWDQLYELQNGKCPICLKPIHRPGNSEGKRAASVDHDHVSKRVRGLLCYHDNRFTIGRLRSVEKLRRVITYLESDFDGRTL